MPCGDRNDKKLILPMEKRFKLLNNLLDECCKSVRLVDDEIKLSREKNRMIGTF